VEKRALKKSINIVGIIVSTRCWIHATVSKIDRSIAPGSRYSKLHLNLQVSSSSSSEFRNPQRKKKQEKNDQTNKQTRCYNTLSFSMFISIPRSENKIAVVDTSCEEHLKWSLLGVCKKNSHSPSLCKLCFGRHFQTDLRR
jgi:hypothetical protein